MCGKMGRVSKKDENTIMVIAVLLVVIIAVAIISGNFFSIACPSSQVVPNTGGGGCYTPPTINNVPSPLILNNIAIWGNGNCNDWTSSMTIRYNCLLLLLLCWYLPIQIRYNNCLSNHYNFRFPILLYY